MTDQTDNVDTTDLRSQVALAAEQQINQETRTYSYQRQVVRRDGTVATVVRTQTRSIPVVKQKRGPKKHDVDSDLAIRVREFYEAQTRKNLTAVAKQFNISPYRVREIIALG